MKISYITLKKIFETILLQKGFSATKATICAEIFASNSRDGVHSHGLNRFPVFIERIKEGLVDIHAEPELSSSIGMIE